METKNLLLGTAAVLGGLVLLAAKGETEDDDEPEVGENHPEVGFAPSPDVELFNPARVTDWVERSPTIGHFYQVRRGDMLLGHGKKSITWTALFNAACVIAEEREEFSEEEIEDYGRAMANNANFRCEYAQLILASTWNDTLYGTWGYRRREFPGHHGRSIPLSTCHADNLARMRSKSEPVRRIEVGRPEDKGTGSAVVNGLSRPLLWLPLINLDALLDGEVTTRDMVWPGESRVSGLEPPPHFWRFA